MKIDWNKVGMIFAAIAVICVILGVSYDMYVEVNKSFLKENHCLEKELKHYRTEGGFLSSTVETTKANSDYSKTVCVKWEEDISFGALLFGQKLVEDKNGR